MTIRSILRKDSLPSGYSDTPFPDSRPQGQTKTQSNWRVKHDGSIEKVDGRTVIYDASTGTIRGLFYPQKKTPLCTLTASNNVLYIKYGSDYKSATVATGTYYTYASLATALQTAIQTATTPANSSTVGYNTGGDLKFIITALGGSTLILCWLHATTTIDKTLFGFYSSVSIANTTHVHSDFTVDNESVNSGIYAHESSTQLLKLFKSDGTQITYPPYGTPPTSLTYSNKDWAGTWSNGRAYLSSGVKNYIIRDKYVRKMPEYDVLKNYGIISTTSDNEIYQLTSSAHDSDLLTLGGTGAITRARFPLETQSTYIYRIDSVSFTMKYQSLGASADLLFYYLVPSKGIRTLIATYRSESLTNSYALTDIGADIFATVANSTPHYIEVEYAPTTSTLLDQTPIMFQGMHDPSPAYQIQTPTADGIWTDIVLVSAYYASIKATEYTGTASYLVRFTLQNAEGVETEMGDYFNGATANSSVARVRIGYQSQGTLKDLLLHDFAYLNIYRTADGYTDAAEDPFFLWLSIPRAVIQNEDNTDTYIDVCLGESGTEEAADTSRTLELEYTISEWWEERQWIVGPDAPFIVYYSQAGEPENFDDSTTGNWISIGRDSMDITGLKAMGDRLVVYKANYLTSIIPAGSDYGVQEIASDGVGTLGQKSIVSVVGVDGQAQYFQGSDGHFYMTDGFRAIPLSKGQLDTFVEALNVTYLNKTSGFYNASKREIVWSVVTGANTAVDSNVVYSFITQRFHIETMPADFWATDNITTTGVTTYVGANTTKLFSYRTANADLSAAIAATYETADLNMGMEDIPKDFHQLEITLRHETNPQSIVITWYTDYATSATGTSTIASTTTTTATKTKIPLNCRGKTIRFKIYNTDSSGYVQFNQLLIEYTPVKEINRGG